MWAALGIIVIIISLASHLRFPRHPPSSSSMVMMRGPIITDASIYASSNPARRDPLFRDDSITPGALLVSKPLTRNPLPIVVPIADSTIISRESGVLVTCDTRGNLGPCSVVVQSPPGNDWLKDRWQAASDMGGTAIPGAHWVILDFQRQAIADKIVLDWETAYADVYRLEGCPKDDIDDDCWKIIYDGTVAKSQLR